MIDGNLIKAINEVITNPTGCQNKVFGEYTISQQEYHFNYDDGGNAKFVVHSEGEGVMIEMWASSYESLSLSNMKTVTGKSKVISTFEF